MLRYSLVLLPILLTGCDMGTYTPSMHHGGDEASTGSHLSGVDGGAQDGSAATTQTYGHFGAGTTPTGSR